MIAVLAMVSAMAAGEAAPGPITDERLIAIARQYAVRHRIDLKSGRLVVVYRGADYETVAFETPGCPAAGCIDGPPLFIIKTATQRVVQYRPGD